MGRGRGTWNARTQGRGDKGHVGTRDVGRIGTQGRDKQTTPDFCAEL